MVIWNTASSILIDLEDAMGNSNEIVTKDKNVFPEFASIRKTILDAREKDLATVNFAMVAAYWAIGNRYMGQRIMQALSTENGCYWII